MCMFMIPMHVTSREYTPQYQQKKNLKNVKSLDSLIYVVKYTKSIKVS